MEHHRYSEETRKQLPVDIHLNEEAKFFSIICQHHWTRNPGDTHETIEFRGEKNQDLDVYVVRISMVNSQCDHCVDTECKKKECAFRNVLYMPDHWSKTVEFLHVVGHLMRGPIDDVQLQHESGSERDYLPTEKQRTKKSRADSDWAPNQPQQKLPLCRNDKFERHINEMLRNISSIQRHGAPEFWSSSFDLDEFRAQCPLHRPGDTKKENSVCRAECTVLGVAPRGGNHRAGSLPRTAWGPIQRTAPYSLDCVARLRGSAHGEHNDTRRRLPPS